MKFYNIRNLAKIILAVFVFNICFVFSGLAHDSCQSERDEVASTRGTLSSAEYDLRMLEESGYLKPVAIGTGLGMLGGASGGWIGVGIGGMAGGIGGAYYYYDQLESAREKVRWAAEKWAQAKLDPSQT